MMASWITQLMITDCNVENEGWTAFMPPREVTHWMHGERKKASDCDAFSLDTMPI